MSSVVESSGMRRSLLVLVPVVFALLLWAGWLLPQRPYAGLVSVAADGTVGTVDPENPAAEALRPGDVIVSIGGTPFEELRKPYSGYRVGDSVPFVVARGGDNLDLFITLVATPPSRLLGGIAPLLLAAAFAVAGTFAYLVAASSVSARLFFLSCQVTAAALGFALVGMARHAWADRLFYILMWLVTPLLVHLHLSFLGSPMRPTWRSLVLILYGVGIAGGLPFLFWGPADLSTPWHGVLYTGARLYVALGVLLAIALLFAGARAGAAAAARRRTRPVLVSGGLVLVLAVGLSVVPDALGMSPILPYRLAFLLLLVLPASYAYAITRAPSPDQALGVEGPATA